MILYTISWKIKNCPVRIFALLIAAHACCYGQKQGNMWYFARELGLNFNYSPPLVLIDGQIDYDDGGTEGSASIASKNGDLLFYANGEKIWNRKHKVMRNGDELMGHRSSTNGAVIVPVPGENAKYYVFNTHAFQERLLTGLRYSIVDMCGDNGYGEVMTSFKNILLLDGAGEKLAVTKHINGIDYWLIAHRHFSNAFHAYLITQNGIETAIISEIGTPHGNKNAPDAVGYQDAIGQMKLSPDGKKLALVMENRSPDVIDLLDFNTTTGKLSAYINLSDGSASGGIYGVAFSPDNTKLYVSGRSGIFQFSLDAGTGSQSEIRQSKYKLANQVTAGGLQLGPDGKIYVSRFDYAAIIESPNLSGSACNFIDDAIYFKGRINLYAFPTFFDSFDYPDKGSLPLEVNIKEQDRLCPGETIALDATSVGENVKYTWPDGSGDPVYNVSEPGEYLVKIQDRFCTVEKKIIVAAPSFGDLGPDITACDEDKVLLSGLTEGGSYHWQNGSSVPTLLVDQPGVYWLDITKDNCTIRDSVKVTFADIPKFSLGNDTTLCEGQDITLSIQVKADSFIWQDGKESPEYLVKGPGNYSATASLNSCTYTDEITVSYVILLPPDAGADTVLCEGSALHLKVDTENASLLWSTGSSEPTISIIESGIYWVELSSSDCSVIDSVQVEFSSCQLIMPNIFTPNGDEFNSNFVPIEMNGIKSGNLIVYNRWGQQLFQTTDLKTGWDGRGQDTHPGVYFWELKYIDIGNSSRTLKGTVMLSK